RLDGITGLERSGDEIRLRAPASSWAHRELLGQQGELVAEARRFFGAAVGVNLLAGTPDPEVLPFPVLASKVWNHVAFWVWDGSRSGALVVRKPRYREVWLATAATAGEEALHPLTEPEVVWLERSLHGGGPGPADALPHLLDELSALTRSAASYAHLVAAFPGDANAEALEARLYGVKEWGTPRTPAPLLQKYVGRLHYADAERPPLGLRLARRLLSHPAVSP
ncbi:MAG: hypothetical protein IH608_08425, partial [Proteobacteria bacterium]|nr:hypothetical protein [Pseudomonadota bacterium]